MIASAPRRGRGKAQKSLELIEACREIGNQIQPASVRAYCYQLFNRKLIPDMSKASTNRVGAQLTWARENGMIPWSWIVDGTREIERPHTWDDPASLLRAAVSQYRQDYWKQQGYLLILCSEKSTVAGTVQPITDRYGIGFMSMHGYGSATSAHDLARLSQYSVQDVVLLYIGDWDPSGMHMSEADLPGRIDRYSGFVEIRRIALTAEDTVRLGFAPSFSADEKRKDPRHGCYVARYGRRCWELDALDPNILRARVEAAIREYIDWPSWERCAAVEQAERDSLLQVVGAWKGGTL
jgi:hypothetical protein